MKDLRGEILEEIKTLSLNSIKNLRKQVKNLEKKNKLLEEKYFEFIYKSNSK